MTPYYDGGNVTIYHGDALDVLPGLPAASVDLIATDPPYFRVKDLPWDRQWDSAAGFLEWVGRLCAEWRRVLKPNGSLYVFASPQMAWHVEGVVREHFHVLTNIRWRKPPFSTKAEMFRKEDLRAPFPASETVIFAEQYGADGAADDGAGWGAACDQLHRRVYGPLGAKVRAIRERAGLSMKDVAQHFPSKTGGVTGCVWNWESGNNLPSEEQYVTICRVCGDRREYEDLRRPFSLRSNVPYTDVWDFPTVNAYPGKHPCEKPLALAEHIVSVSSRPGDTVLDGFAGSGVFGEAAALHGRKFVGVELDPHWCGRARDRIAQAGASLFAGAGTDGAAATPGLFAAAD